MYYYLKINILVFLFILLIQHLKLCNNFQNQDIFLCSKQCGMNLPASTDPESSFPISLLVDVWFWNSRVMVSLSQENFLLLAFLFNCMYTVHHIHAKARGRPSSILSPPLHLSYLRECLSHNF